MYRIPLYTDTLYVKSSDGESTPVRVNVDKGIEEVRLRLGPGGKYEIFLPKADAAKLGSMLSEASSMVNT